MKEAANQVLTINLRSQLKELFAEELAKLPDYLKELETKERLEYLIKFMPFVLPKVNNVNIKNGEPDEFKIREYHY